MSEILHYYWQLPHWELIAVFTALLYVVLAAKENIWCWPAALISTMIYTVIFYDVFLWMDSLLQVYYLAMAVYGWFCWRKVSTSRDTKKGTQLKIQSWSLILHVKVVIILTGISFSVGWLMDSYTPTDFPYIDSATTVFAVFATYLVTKKVLENWLYWIVIDAVSIYLYIEKGLLPTAVLFGLYVVLASYGYIKWQGKLNNKTQLALG
jgi:nicotinamide mononucleotide transporter